MTLDEAIKALGNTPEEVSAKLQSMGIKGYRQVACVCPIAKYLNACGFPHVTVATYVNVYQTGKSEYADQTYHLPKGVRDWICQFDDGKLPEFCLPIG